MRSRRTKAKKFGRSRAAEFLDNPNPECSSSPSCSCALPASGLRSLPAACGPNCACCMLLAAALLSSCCAFHFVALLFVERHLERVERLLAVLCHASLSIRLCAQRSSEARSLHIYAPKVVLYFAQVSRVPEPYVNISPVSSHVSVLVLYL